MILTCPACDTKYVVKDSAIPPGGRQVLAVEVRDAGRDDRLVAYGFTGAVPGSSSLATEH